MVRRLLFAFGLALAAACNTAPFTPAPAIDCSKTDCTCEEDPSQPTCRGFPGLPEAGLGPFPEEDAAPEDAGETDADPDAGDSGPTDASDDADA